MLALQGGFARHCAALRDLGHEAVEVRYAAQLTGLGGLVIPGGESTTMLNLIERARLSAPLGEFVGGGRPVLLTCAGVILAARRVTGPEQPSFGWLDIEVKRNGWGRQLDSFEDTDDAGELALLFIRAPRITAVGPSAEVLARLKGEPILVRQGRVVGATFHPELTADRRIHREVFGEAQR